MLKKFKKWRPQHRLSLRKDLSASWNRAECVCGVWGGMWKCFLCVCVRLTSSPSVHSLFLSETSCLLQSMQQNPAVGLQWSITLLLFLLLAPPPQHSHAVRSSPSVPTFFFSKDKKCYFFQFSVPSLHTEPRHLYIAVCMRVYVRQVNTLMLFFFTLL